MFLKLKMTELTETRHFLKNFAENRKMSFHKIRSKFKFKASMKVSEGLVHK